jgi:HK97 family phage portal protein
VGARDLVSGALRTVLRAVEGAFRPGPYYLRYSGGWLPNGSASNFWQLGQNVQPWSTSSAVVEACISAYSQTAAMCPGTHWRLNAKGGRDRVTTSSLSRVLKQPNDYQSISDFLLNAVRQVYLEGNAYALALRNDRYEIDELHLMDSWLSRPQLSVDGEVFYRLYGNQVMARRLDEKPLIVPARDVLHIRLHVDRSRRYPFPLWGQTPLLAALNDVGLSEAIATQQMGFYQNQARPSAVVSTDMVLDKDKVQDLRDRLNEVTTGAAAGGVPILTHGLKMQPWTIGGRDAQLAEMLKISEEHIAMVFRVPMQLLGLGGAPLGSTEALMQFWISTGLGFLLNHIEEAFGVLFALDGQPDEYVELDTAALLRSNQKERIEALARGVQGGIYSPNEARQFEGLPAVKSGNEPRVQAQVVPLSAAGAIPSSKSSPAAPAAPGPPGGPPAPAEPKLSNGNGNGQDKQAEYVNVIKRDSSREILRYSRKRFNA